MNNYIQLLEEIVEQKFGADVFKTLGINRVSFQDPSFISNPKK
jgi:hypothetical protein